MNTVYPNRSPAFSRILRFQLPELGMVESGDKPREMDIRLIGPPLTRHSSCTPTETWHCKVAVKRSEFADAGSAVWSSTGGDYHYRIKHLPLE